MFLFTTRRSSSKVFLEDINNILNTGEVPELVREGRGHAQVCEHAAVRAKKAGTPDGRAELVQYFVQQCRANLHVVLCFSPSATRSASAFGSSRRS